MKVKKFLIGVAIFIVTIIFIVFTNLALNPEPKYPDCTHSRNNYNYGTNMNDYQYQTCYDNYLQSTKDYKEMAFIIITALSLLAIIAGVLVRSVVPVSWGLGLAGLVMIIYIFIANYDEIGKPYRAIISGIALAILIWLAYAKLGDRERLEGENPAPAPSIPLRDNVPPAPPIEPDETLTEKKPTLK